MSARTLESRIAITGTGLVSAAGAGTNALWSAMEARRECLRTFEQIDARDLVMTRGGEVPNAVLESEWTGPNDDRALRMACLGAAEALERARLGPFASTDSSATTVGLVLGTALGSVQTLETLARRESDRLGWKDVPQSSLAFELERRFGLDGPRWNFSVTCVSGLYALEQAIADLRFGRAEAVLCGGLDTLSLFMQSGFCALRALSPSGRLRPFDVEHDGIVLGEGAAFVVVETVESARARDVEPIAEIAANALVSDGTHLTSPDASGAGMARAIANAMGESGHLTPGSIGCITPTANGSPVYDAMQCRAVLEALGGEAGRIPVTTWEPAIGHALASTGVLGIVHAAMVVERGEILSTFGAETIAEECELAYFLGGGARAFEGEAVLALTVGFGGQNGATLVRSPSSREGRPRPAFADVDDQASVRVVSTCAVGRWQADDDERALFECSRVETPERASDGETLAALFPGRWNARRDLPRGLGCLVSAFAGALESAGWWRPGQDGPVDGGLVLASDSHSLLEARDHATELGRVGPAGISPSGFLFSLPSSSAAVLGILFGLRDYQATLTDGDGGGAQALRHALDRIRLGKARRLAVGALSRSTPELMALLPEAARGLPDALAGEMELAVCVVLESGGSLSHVHASRPRAAGLDGEPRDVFSSASLAATELLAFAREQAPH